ncbi:MULTISPECIES: XdhC/CoxI family protein [Clostridium]|uniref:XdhC family protein n=1 Tax=Clostridium TaxID=1485 RepID=UPI0012B72096|nr:MULTISPECIES: XdhC/CoxI family protein [Clostridium]MDU0324943.1 XdhC/CoxI family protein [Clostridium butyricum]MDU6540928.1 XdhC/CoxI family protein [Clostridium sp.]
MGKRLYKQVIRELNENGFVKTLTVISQNENIGKKIIVNKNLNDSINDYDVDEIKYDKFLKDSIKDVDLKNGTHTCKIGNEEIFVEDIVGKPKLIICGGGHIALPLSKMGKMLEFHVTVIDNRIEFASKERFAHVDKIICMDFDEAIEEAKVNSNTYIVIVTRGHKDDRKCLEKVIRTDHKYIGMIGSRGKVASVFNAMIKEGYREEELEKVYSPIGLKIGAQTPEEIAVSIFAEIIEVKNKKMACNIEDSIIAKLDSSSENMVLATIVEKSGSTPRGVGAKMLIIEDGGVIGTVGGGSVENAVYEKAIELIKIQKCHIETYDLSNSKASKLGMACGGSVKVLFEYISSNS